MMNPLLVKLFREARAMHESLVTADAELRRLINQTPCRETQADTAYALRETSKFADDVRKRCDELSALAQRLACVLSVAEQNTSTIRTERCSATLDIKSIATIPKQSTHPEQFAQLMEYLGVARHLWEVPNEAEVEEESERMHAIVKPHFPGLVQHLNRMMAEGKPLPPGLDLDKTYNDYRLIIRKKKGVTE